VFTAIDCFSFPLRRQQIDRAAAIVVAGEQALFLQVGNVLMHGGQGIQAHGFLDLFKRRGVSLLHHEARNEVVELALTPSDRHARSIGECMANVNRMADAIVVQFAKSQTTKATKVHQGNTSGQKPS
jgi:hypothetical protein